jgi:tetratricopeptide (TPR) repeat protein
MSNEAQTIDHIDTNEPDAPAGRRPAKPVVSPAGFEVHEEIGQGGMGVVYRARDLTLNREVAIKVLQDRYPAGSATAARFVEEAQITSQLQHPGIPAVYQVGQLPDERPYLAMKLIRGETLEEKLKLATPVSPLPVMEAIAQAVGFAHSQGVIHRDLKPANVMVGRFGEVQVMDWGLAKHLSAPERTEPHADLATHRDADGSFTQAGSVMGTPAYMPPEQANGDIEQIDQRADVFGLGAILCTILTGHPPYTGESAASLRAAASRGDTADAFRRLDAAAVDPEIVALCKACLSFDPKDRPADGTAVAERIAAIRASADDRARQAEVSRAAAEVRSAEQQKRRRAMFVAAFAISAAFAVGIVGTTLGMIRARAARSDAESAKQGEADQRQKAQDRLVKAVSAVEQLMTRVSGERWAARPEMQAERREMLEEAVAFFRSFDEADSRDPAVRRQTARAYLLTGVAYISLGEYDECAGAVGPARDLYAGLVAEFPADMPSRRGLVESVALQGHVAAIAADYATAQEKYAEALRLAEAASGIDPTSEDAKVAVAEMNTSLALFYSFQQPEKSVEFHNKALAIGEQLTGGGRASFRGRLVVFSALVNLATTDIQTGRVGPALQKFDRAHGMIPGMDAVPPPSARAAESYGLAKATLGVFRGMLLYRTGKKPDGLAGIRGGLELIDRLLVVQPKSFPLRVKKLQFLATYADLLMRDNDRAEAEKVFGILKQEEERMVAESPSAGWVRRIGMLQRSMFLVAQAADGLADAVERSAEELLKTQEPQLGLIVQYNVACAYSQLAKSAPTADRGKYADRAVTLLEDLKAKGYYKSAGNVRHLAADTDFDPIRGHDGFKKFVAALPKSDEPKKN